MKLIATITHEASAGEDYIEFADEHGNQYRGDIIARKSPAFIINTTTGIAMFIKVDEDGDPKFMVCVLGTDFETDIHKYRVTLKDDETQQWEKLS
jgi:hypothetical protein